MRPERVLEWIVVSSMMLVLERWISEFEMPMRTLEDQKERLLMIL